MSWLTKVPALARARRALAARAYDVWNRDRAGLRALPSLGNRVCRIAILVVRGIFTHRLGLQAAALTYYSVFAIVPLLVVLLRLLQLLDHLPVIAPDRLPDRLPGNAGGFTGNQLLHATLGTILEAVNRTSELTSGVVGLVALLFAVTKMFIYTERALHIIAGSAQRAPRFARLLGYGALLLIPPVMLAISGLLLALFTRSLGHELFRWLGAIPGLELAAGAGLGYAGLWAAVTTFYSASARARIPLSSAAVGGAAAAAALVVVFWVFTGFQIGVAQAAELGTGFLAVPVFLLWVFSSWCAVLVGAEIAVAHRVDRVLIHGARAFRLDAVGQRQAAVAIMVEVARAARLKDDRRVLVTEDELARELRLSPHLVRDLCLRLAARGLLAEEARGFSLGCDPDRTRLAALVDAVERDPALAAAHAEALGPLRPDVQHALVRCGGRAPGGDGGPTLRELADAANTSG